MCSGRSDAELMRLSDEDGEAFGFLHDRHVAAILETPSPRELKTQDTNPGPTP